MICKSASPTSQSTRWGRISHEISLIDDSHDHPVQLCATFNPYSITCGRPWNIYIDAWVQLMDAVAISAAKTLLRMDIFCTVSRFLLLVCRRLAILPHFRVRRLSRSCSFFIHADNAPHSRCVVRFTAPLIGSWLAVPIVQKHDIRKYPAAIIVSAFSSFVSHSFLFLAIFSSRFSSLPLYWIFYGKSNTLSLFSFQFHSIIFFVSVR